MLKGNTVPEASLLGGQCTVRGCPKASGMEAAHYIWDVSQLEPEHQQPSLSREATSMRAFQWPSPKTCCTGTVASSLLRRPSRQKPAAPMARPLVSPISARELRVSSPGGRV